MDLYQFKHGDRIKRRTSTNGVFIYGVYLGTILDYYGDQLCICINPDVNREAYFMARPGDLFPLEEPPASKPQLPLTSSKW